MAQITIADGDYPTAAQFNTYMVGEGGAWTSWTPTVTQSGSVTVTNTRSRYARYGRTFIVATKLTVTGSGTGANAVVISLPVTAAASLVLAAGGGSIFDSSATAEHRGLAYLASTTTFALLPTANTTADFMGSTGFTAGLAAGDVINASFTYEAAS